MPQTAQMVRVLEADPDLAEGLDPEQERLARAAAVARVDELEPGEWEGDEEYPAAAGHLGLLVLEGLLAREVQLGDRPCAELLGPGDLLRPWVQVSGYSSLPVDSRWTVVERTRVAVLDRRFAATIAKYPEVMGRILDRMMVRSRWLAFHLAVCRLRLIEERLVVTLWHFADRWGRVTSEGVVLPLHITHRMLAGVIGAERPTVTTALGALRRRGLVDRREDGSWVLHGPPPEALAQVSEGARGRPLPASELG